MATEGQQVGSQLVSGNHSWRNYHSSGLHDYTGLIIMTNLLSGMIIQVRNGHWEWWWWSVNCQWFETSIIIIKPMHDRAMNYWTCHGFCLSSFFDARVSGAVLAHHDHIVASSSDLMAKVVSGEQWSPSVHDVIWCELQVLYQLVLINTVATLLQHCEWFVQWCCLFRVDRDTSLGLGGCWLEILGHCFGDSIVMSFGDIFAVASQQ